MNLEQTTQEVIEVARHAGEFLRKESHKIAASDVVEKSLNSLVTYVDKEAENQIVGALKTVLPEAGFIAEENPDLMKHSSLNWIIDPLDGTTNYIHGVPVYAVSIALEQDHEILLGVVYEVSRDECFYSWAGAPSYLNGSTITVSGTQSLQNSLLATGFPYHDYGIMDPYLSLFDELMRSSRGIRRLGSAAVDLCYVAAGRFEVFYEYGLNPWDVAAGALIVRNANGAVSDFKGGDNYIYGNGIVASNRLTHDEFLSKLSKHF